MKYILALFFVGLSTVSYAQKNFDFATVKEYNFYRPDYNDSFKVAYYTSGALKYEQNEEREIYYYYIDSSKNDSLYSSILTLPRFSHQDCKDSTRDVFTYKDGKLLEIFTYKKTCYREREGCAIYDNTNAGQWCLDSRQFFKTNEHNDFTEITFITENIIWADIIPGTGSNHEIRLDTSVYTNEYTYDTLGRRTQFRTYEKGKPEYKVNYKYFDGIKREEFYLPEDSTARRITDYKYQNGQLVEKFVDWKNKRPSETEKYLYIQPNRLASIEYIEGKTNLYKVRKYYY